MVTARGAVSGPGPWGVRRSGTSSHRSSGHRGQEDRRQLDRPIAVRDRRWRSQAGHPASRRGRTGRNHDLRARNAGAVDEHRQFVPETWGLRVTTPCRPLRHTGSGKLLKDAFTRLRFSDGFSHARSLAYTVSLILVQGIIAVVGLATALGEGRISNVIVRPLDSVVPGPAGEVLTTPSRRPSRPGPPAGSWRWSRLVGALITATLAWLSSSGRSTASTASSRTGRRRRSTGWPSYSP